MLLSVYSAAKPSAGRSQDGQAASEAGCLGVSVAALSIAFAAAAERFRISVSFHPAAASFPGDANTGLFVLVFVFELRGGVLGAGAFAQISLALFEIASRTPGITLPFTVRSERMYFSSIPHSSLKYPAKSSSSPSSIM